MTDSKTGFHTMGVQGVFSFHFVFVFPFPICSFYLTFSLPTHPPHRCLTKRKMSEEGKEKAIYLSTAPPRTAPPRSQRRIPLKITKNGGK